MEMTIRAYDPCLSCASHDLNGQLGCKVDIVGADGELIETLTNQ